jgi:hypothetical protein
MPRANAGRPLPGRTIAAIARYLCARYGEGTELMDASAIGEATSARSVKGFGYGTPIAVTFRRGRRTERVVIETMKPGPFGHEHRADRAQAILWDYDSYARLPRHVPALDVGAFTASGELMSLRDAREHFLLTAWTEGRSYHEDLDRIAASGRLTALDHRRARALAEYLAGVHRRKRRDPALYRRRLRELIGHGECIMGLTDSYPRRFAFIDEALLRSIETRANAWRWQLRHHAARLCAVHGDFHPWNILFRRGVDFSTLDRSRGEWGEAADDVTALAINYVFFSVRRYGSLAGPFATLFRAFWDRYVEASRDRALGSCVAPFFAFRGLVIASPLWYPTLSLEVRRKLFRFIDSVLAEPRFDPRAVNHYLEAR